MNTDWVKSCTKRHLSKSSYFVPPFPHRDDALFGKFPHGIRAWSELGSVVGNPAEEHNRVWIFDEGIVYSDNGSWTKLSYDQIERVVLGGDKRTSDLVLERVDGESVKVRITVLPNDKYNPILQLLTFLGCAGDTPPPAFIA